MHLTQSLLTLAVDKGDSSTTHMSTGHQDLRHRSLPPLPHHASPDQFSQSESHPGHDKHQLERPSSTGLGPSRFIDLDSSEGHLATASVSSVQPNLGTWHWQWDTLDIPKGSSALSSSRDVISRKLVSPRSSITGLAGYGQSSDASPTHVHSSRRPSHSRSQSLDPQTLSPRSQLVRSSWTSSAPLPMSSPSEPSYDQPVSASAMRRGSASLSFSQRHGAFPTSWSCSALGPILEGGEGPETPAAAKSKPLPLVPDSHGEEEAVANEAGRHQEVIRFGSVSSASSTASTVIGRHRPSWSMSDAGMLDVQSREPQGLTREVPVSLPTRRRSSLSSAMSDSRKPAPLHSSQDKNEPREWTQGWTITPYGNDDVDNSPPMKKDPTVARSASSSPVFRRVLAQIQSEREPSQDSVHRRAESSFASTAAISILSLGQFPDPPATAENQENEERAGAVEDEKMTMEAQSSDWFQDEEEQSGDEAEVDQAGSPPISHEERLVKDDSACNLTVPTAGDNTWRRTSLSKYRINSTDANGAAPSEADSMSVYSVDDAMGHGPLAASRRATSFSGGTFAHWSWNSGIHNAHFTQSISPATISFEDIKPEPNTTTSWNDVDPDDSDIARRMPFTALHIGSSPLGPTATPSPSAELRERATGTKVHARRMSRQDLAPWLGNSQQERPQDPQQHSSSPVPSSSSPVPETICSGSPWSRFGFDGPPEASRAQVGLGVGLRTEGDMERCASGGTTITIPSDCTDHQEQDWQPVFDELKKSDNDKVDEEVSLALSRFVFSNPGELGHEYDDGPVSPLFLNGDASPRSTVLSTTTVTKLARAYSTREVARRSDERRRRYAVERQLLYGEPGPDEATHEFGLAL